MPTVALSIQQWKTGDRSRVISVAAHPSQHLVGTSLLNGDLLLYDPATGQRVAEIAASGVNSMTFMNTKPLIACVNLYGTVDFWDIENKAMIKRHHTHGAVQVQASLRLSPDESRLVVGSNDGTVKLFKVNQLLKHRSYLVGHDGAINMICFSDDGKQLISAGRDGRANQYNPQTGERLSQLYEHTTSLESVAMSSESTVHYFGGADGAVAVQDASTGELTTLQAGSKAVRVIVDLPDADEFLTAGADGGVRLCRIRSASSQLLFTHSGVVKSAPMSVDGKSLITASADGVIRFTSTSDWTESKKIDDAGSGIFSMALSHSGQQLAVGLQTGRVRIFDIGLGTWQATLPVHSGPVQSVLFTNSDNTIISGGNDRAVIISDLEIGEKKMGLAWHFKQVRCLALAPDDSVLVSCDNSGEANLWRAPRPAPSFARFEP